MDIFFRGTITSSPIKTWNTEGHQPSYRSSPVKPQTPQDLCEVVDRAGTECVVPTMKYGGWITDETGSVHVCRRSPRLLANGYYVLTEDSVVTDDHGNLTLTPTQTNISYKENLARIFRRRRKARRSFATLLNDVSQTLLSGSIFGKDGTLSSTDLSSCLDVSSSTEKDTSVYFTYDPTEHLLPEMESHTEDCSASVLPVQSLNSPTDVLPQSKCYCSGSPSDAMFRKACLVLLFTLCLCAAMFSRCVCGAIAVAVVFLFLMTSVCGSISGRVCTCWTKTEDITSSNE